MRRILIAARCLLLACILLTSCNQLNQWRAGQIQQSHQAAQGSIITPPAQPPSVPDSVRRELPLDNSFTVLNYSDGEDGNPCDLG